MLPFQSLTGYPDSFVLGPLQQGTNYLTPQRNDQLGKQCDCNTVMFRYEVDPYVHSARGLIVVLCSLYMACTACQNVTTQSWRYWSQFCDVVYVTQFPGTIPLGTAVPRWAFLNYTVRARYRKSGAKSSVSYYLGLGGRRIRSWCREGGGGPAREHRISTPDWFTVRQFYGFRFAVSHHSKWKPNRPGDPEIVQYRCDRWRCDRWFGGFGLDWGRSLYIP